jgi:adenine-specific DNA-methyltransferase
MSKELGQYFTKDKSLRNFITDIVRYKADTLLEPSFGQGHIINEIIAEWPMRNIVGFEIDTNLKSKLVIKNLNPSRHILHWTNFLEYNFDSKFRTIIGNPPYVKVKGDTNLYLKFIDKCLDLMDPTGSELIFIVPSDFLQLTSAAPIIRRMVTSGAFTTIWYPQKENLFEGASIDVMVFRYEMAGGLHYPYKNTRVINGETHSTTSFAIDEGRLVRVQEDMRPIHRDFTIFVGMVSGKDGVFKAPIGNMDVLTGHNRIEKFIFVDKFPTKNEEIDSHLLRHKDQLMERKITKQTESNWFKWGAVRNKNLVDNLHGRDCIYVKTLTRDKEVAFVGKVRYFGGSLLCMCPFILDHKMNLQKIADYLNSDEGRREYTFSGRYKMGASLLMDVKYPLAQSPAALL